MRYTIRNLWSLFFVIAVLFAAVAECWSKEDHEIFRLRDEVLANENQTFYEFIGVSPGATIDQINTAYRKRSRLLHPDRAVTAYSTSGLKYGEKKPTSADGSEPASKKKPTVRQIAQYRKECQDRFARLGVVITILRGPMRDRYDFFLKNGFPTWRGTGYYYNRLRPGATSVLLGLFLFAGGVVHYGALYLGWTRRREFLERCISHARTQAGLTISGVRTWDAQMLTDTPTPPVTVGTPVQDDVEIVAEQPKNRKERRAQEAEVRRRTGKKATGLSGKIDKRQASRKVGASSGKKGNRSDSPADDGIAYSGIKPSGTLCRVVAPNGKSLIVDSLKNVFVEAMDEDGILHRDHLDLEADPAPTVRDTFAYRLPMFVYKSTVGRFFPHADEGGNEHLLDPQDDINGMEDADEAPVAQAMSTGVKA